MRTRFSRCFSLALATTLSLACANQAPAPPTGPRAVRAVAVRSEVAQQSSTYAGSLEPRTRVELAFGVPGRVRSLGTTRDGGKERPLREGDAVRKGQVLAMLDDSDLQRQASASSLALSGAASELVAAEASLAQTEADATRARSLAAAGSMATAELGRIENALKTSQGRVDSLRAQKAARAEQLAIARRAASDARMLSPMDGLLARRMVDAGENVNPSTLVMSIIDTAELKLLFAVPDTRIAAVSLGAIIPVHVEALGAHPLAGRVAAIQPVADPLLRTFTVEVTVQNEGGLLRAGTVASASLGTARKEAVVLVPLASIVRRADGTLGAFRLEDAAKVRLVGVDLGDLVGNDVMVKAGLGPGDRVVTDGAPFLHDGEAVEVLP